MRYAVGFLFFSGIWIISCKPKGTSHSTQHTDSVSIDSSKLLSDEDIVYVFYDSIPIYDDNNEKVVEYLIVGDSVWLDKGETLEQNSEMKDVSFSYLANGKRKKGKSSAGNFSITTCWSFVDANTRFMANVFKDTDEMSYAWVRSVEKNKLIEEFKISLGIQEDFNILMYVVDSLKYPNVKEVIYVTFYQGFGEFESHDYYFARHDGQLDRILWYYGKAGGDETDYCSFYFPYKNGKKWVMSPYYMEGASRDSNNRVIGIAIPDKFKGMEKDLIYVQNIGNEEQKRWSLWLKWNGKSIDTLTTKK
jgi:hypothetical protein